MYVKGNDRFYYLTLMNENYSHPKRPKNATTENIIKGAYRYLENKDPSLRILASGVTLNFAVDAEKELKKLGISTEIWSVTSFNELYKDGIEVERLNRYENKKVSHMSSHAFQNVCQQ